MWLYDTSTMVEFYERARAAQLEAAGPGKSVCQDPGLPLFRIRSVCPPWKLNTAGSGDHLGGGGGDDGHSQGGSNTGGSDESGELFVTPDMVMPLPITGKPFELHSQTVTRIRYIKVHITVHITV